MRDLDGTATVTPAEAQANFEANLQAVLRRASGSEVEVVASEIEKVIVVLDSQAGVLAGQRVDVEGHIAGLALGQGSEAARVARHGLRAHGVVIDTLRDVRADLERFRTSVAEARAHLEETDRAAAHDARLLLRSTEGLDAGRGAYQRSQVDHAVVTPSAEQG